MRTVNSPNIKLHRNNGYSDGRPQWVVGEAEEIKEEHDLWPAGVSSITHRVWLEPELGKIYTWPKDDVYKLRRLMAKVKTSDVPLTPTERRELAQLTKVKG